LDACVQVPGYDGCILCPPRGVLCTSEHLSQATVTGETHMLTTAIVNTSTSAGSHSCSTFETVLFFHVHTQFCLRTFWMRLTLSCKASRLAILTSCRPHRSTVYVDALQPIVIDGVAWSVCQSVCLSRSCAVQKWLNQSTCRLGCGLWWAQGT